ncbi:hypothetical protein T439DRAFT_326326 [Meredithblackwellia eburnea MCA 4105]
MPGLPPPTTTSNSVTASLNFLSPDLVPKPFSWLGTPPEGEPSTNIDPCPIDTLITDLREVDENDFGVDTAGFQVVRHESSHLGELETEEGKQNYFKETEELLLGILPKATRIKIFNSTIRKKKHDAPLTGTARTPENTGPVSRAHVDNTSLSGERRVWAEMGEEAEELSNGRCQIINVWRPLSHPAVDCPLAVMDYRTLDFDKDLRATDLILSNEGNRKGENFSVYSNPSQRWYYLSNQTPSEALVFKIYDSLVSPGVSRLTPHSAFVNPLAPADAKARQSIELRALVFY